ncbi:MAG: hypothetical protein SA339_06190 [Methanomassiliicoccus sp.]|nr:hypothetical protein [Methanomassiliicoccus sp.]
MAASARRVMEMIDGSPDQTTAPIRRRLTRLGLAQGTVSDAVTVAGVKAVIFIVVPFVLTTLLLLGAEGDQTISGLEEVRTNAILFGVPVVIISFAWAYHLRITKARMLFGLIGAAFLVIYSYGIFLTGGFSRAMTGFGWVLPAIQLFGLSCYLALGSATRFVRDYQFFRTALARSTSSAPDYRPKLGAGEFDLRLGSYAAAASSTNRFIGQVVVRWSFVLLAFAWLFSLLGFDSTGNGAAFIDIITNMVGLILLLGIPMVVLAWFKGFYPKGTISRTVFDVSTSLTFVLLIFVIFALSGLPQAARTSDVDFPIWPIVIALALWAAIDVFRAIGEFWDERRPWKIRNGFEVSRKKRSWSAHPDSRIYEISPAIGNTSRGLAMAQKTFFRFVTLVVIFVILSLAAGRAAGVQTGPLFDAMRNMVYLVLLFGSLLTVISFGRGFYPAGSLGRLLVGLLLVPGLFLYVFSTFLTPAVEDACRQAGLIIPFNLVVTLVIVSILFVGFLQVTEFIDARRAWLTSVGRRVKPLKPIKKMTRIQEFRFRFGSTYEGTRWARKGIVRYLYYTTIIIIVILTVIESTGYSIGGIDLSGLDTNLRQTYIFIVLLAIPLAAARAIYGFYQAGSTSKLTFGLIMCLVGASYTYLALQGGHIVRGGDLGRVKAGMAVDFTFIVYAFLIGWSIFVLMVLVEYLLYRREWVANDYHPVTSTEVQALNREQRLIEKEENRAKRVQVEGLTYAEVEAEEAPDAEADVEEEIRQEIGEDALRSSKAAVRKTP